MTVAAVAIFVLAACEADGDGRRFVGQLESDRIEISADYAEPIVDRAVAEGERVSAGQLLLRQDTARIDARIGEADATLQQARARLDEIVRGPRREQIDAARATVEGARKDLDFRETELGRAQDLFDRSLTSSEARDRARAARDAARASLDSFEARLDELLSGATVEELRQAEAAVAVAERRIASLGVERDRHTLRAPVAGVVDSLLFEPGEKPAGGQPVAILLGGEQAYARIFVPESLRVQVVPGTRAWVHVDGMAAPVEGRVRWISAESAFTPYYALTEDDRGRLSFAAKIDIEGVDRRLPEGVPVEVELDIAPGGN
ncbi:MAG: HlyD family efflux transporter periplasmic adaptor subunit [Gammaproteobacteria bacterium]|nr:HlyD family efflux transporter periplasmic adaptor subunit [Gammaproteobacteria bacterium]MDH5344993.1 HlyD family efflux transporter periplasmic adaptor subunit [Gammaproteobacteria bacterium]